MESIPVLTVLSLVLLFFIWGTISFFGKMEETKRNKQIAEEKITELQKEKEKLSADISKLQTDQGVEASIRDKFGLAKDGEGLIVVRNNKKFI